jgi:hypothetical protein
VSTNAVVDKRKLLEVEEQRRRAEQDKLAAIIDLERLSRDLLQVLHRLHRIYILLSSNSKHIRFL